MSSATEISTWARCTGAACFTGALSGALELGALDTGAAGVLGASTVDGAVEAGSSAPAGTAIPPVSRAAAARTAKERAMDLALLEKRERPPPEPGEGLSR
ncbi:hypothetical protein AB0J40_35355 [Amycolatopsis sp. NPDC049691]|uniref:hypothetical protein n=1 Tax=Amycolatopsis sp. NPDC049691 TaxID=3155155 RepID=UPI00342A39DC